MNNQDMPLVAVTQRIDFVQDRSEFRDSLDQRLTNFLLSARLLPIPIPNNLNFASNELIDWYKRLNPDGIILSGGGSLGENKNRDVTEEILLEFALVNQIPILGICRGMQVMCYKFGINLKMIKSHVKKSHKLITKVNHLKLPEKVNSFHEFAIESCPAEFKIIAVAEDGVIEGIQHETLPWLGIMWHPERESPYSQFDLDLIKNLFTLNRSKS